MSILSRELLEHSPPQLHLVTSDDELALEHALYDSDSPAQVVALPTPHLTRMEAIHFAWAVQGLGMSEVAEQNYYTIGTVKTHRSNMIRKFGATTMAGVIRPVLALGLVPITVNPLGMEYDQLTPREHEAIYWASYDIDMGVTADQMSIKRRSVKAYRSNAFMKLNAHNRVQAVWKSFEFGILDLPTVANSHAVKLEPIRKPEIFAVTA